MCRERGPLEGGSIRVQGLKGLGNGAVLQGLAIQSAQGVEALLHMAAGRLGAVHVGGADVGEAAQAGCLPGQVCQARRGLLLPATLASCAARQHLSWAGDA